MGEGGGGEREEGRGRREEGGGEREEGRGRREEGGGRREEGGGEREGQKGRKGEGRGGEREERRGRRGEGGGRREEGGGLTNCDGISTDFAPTNFNRSAEHPVGKRKGRMVGLMVWGTQTHQCPTMLYCLMGTSCPAIVPADEWPGDKVSFT